MPPIRGFELVGPIHRPDRLDHRIGELSLVVEFHRLQNHCELLRNVPELFRAIQLFGRGPHTDRWTVRHTPTLLGQAQQ